MLEDASELEAFIDSMHIDLQCHGRGAIREALEDTEDGGFLLGAFPQHTADPGC